MKTVRLYGHLGKKFGRKFKLDVKDTAEAIRALCTVVNGFADYMIEDKEGYRVFIGKNNLDENELAHRHAGDIKIVPVVSGSGSFGKIILGAALIYLTWGTGATLFGSMALNSFVASVGFSLVLGGVAQMLFKPPSVKAPKERPANMPSYAFDGAVNTVAQGNAVPLCYGTLLVGSQVISTGLSVESIDARSNVAPTTTGKV
jgi:predicted phage tail protein